MNSNEADTNGLLVIDKPAGMTSREAVNRVQRWFPKRTKIGHTGTLDPLATGVLVVCVGSATRLADYVQAMDKCYVSRFRLGATSTTDDADGVITEVRDASVPTEEALRAALAGFVGTLKQVPPAFSALKVAGNRAYELARAGRMPDLIARSVEVYAIRLQRYAWPHVEVEIECGKGTYIRSIARDLGVGLGCGGLVETLRRTRVGSFTVEEAVDLTSPPQEVRLLPMIRAVSHLPRLQLDGPTLNRLRHGQAVRTDDLWSPMVCSQGEVAVTDEGGQLVAVASLRSGRLQPRITFPSGTA